MIMGVLSWGIGHVSIWNDQFDYIENWRYQGGRDGGWKREEVKSQTWQMGIARINNELSALNLAHTCCSDFALRDGANENPNQALLGNPPIPPTRALNIPRDLSSKGGRPSPWPGWALVGMPVEGPPRPSKKLAIMAVRDRHQGLANDAER